MRRHRTAARETSIEFEEISFVELFLADPLYDIVGLTGLKTV